MTNGLRWMRAGVTAAVVALSVTMLPATGIGAGVVSAASPVAATKSMTGEQVRRKQLRKAKITFLDTRSSIDGDVIDGAYNVTPELVSAWGARVPRNTLIVAYCTCEDDGLAIQAVEALQQMGFTNAFVLKGGLDGARAAGVPMGRLAG